jgi:hypothetical protein
MLVSPEFKKETRTNVVFVISTWISDRVLESYGSNCALAFVELDNLAMHIKIIQVPFSVGKNVHIFTLTKQTEKRLPVPWLSSRVNNVF